MQHGRTSSKRTVRTLIHVYVDAQSVSIDLVSNRTFRWPHSHVRQLYKSGLTSVMFDSLIGTVWTLRSFRTIDVQACMQFFLNATLESIYATWPYVLKTDCTNLIHVYVVVQSISIDLVSNRTFGWPYSPVRQLYISGLTSATFGYLCKTV